MLEIRTDISSLTKRQREMLTGFILTFDLPEHEQLEFRTLGEHVADGLDACKHVADAAKDAAPTVNKSPTFGEIVGEAFAEIFKPETPTPPSPAEFDPNAAFANEAPAPPPPPPTPISTTGPHLVVGEQPAVDKSGAVWDERYHASSKALTADGLWRKRRGVADAPPPPPPAPGATAAAPPPPPAGPDPRLALYVSLVRETAAAAASKLVTQEEFKAIAVKHGVASIPLIANALDKAEAITEECRALIASRTPSA